ncbi:hypothetical protein Nepgr_030074 [Nepenthes gracilis]|uniref:Uncharacterized protein n=1 Tax=Nepenthes gracilis TaxID=150966 RepID=A0AAD3Y674_NEPGR|nr:hypothetical protein Nepgr_030074 [Nepenthes gracilis]
MLFSFLLLIEEECSEELLSCFLLPLLAAEGQADTSDGCVPISGVESNSQIGAALGLGLEALPQVDHSASTSDDSLPPLDFKACSPNALMPDSVHPSTSVLHEDCGPQLAEPPIDSEALSGQCSSLLNDADPQLPELDIVWPVIQDPIPSQLGLAISSSFSVDNGPHSCLLDTSGDLAVEALVAAMDVPHAGTAVECIDVENSTSIGCSLCCWYWLYAAGAKAADAARLIVMQYGMLNVGVLLWFTAECRN